MSVSECRGGESLCRAEQHRQVQASALGEDREWTEVIAALLPLQTYKQQGPR